MLASSVSPRRIEYSPEVTGTDTGKSGSSSPSPSGELNQSTVESLLFTSANLNCPIPSKQSPLQSHVPENLVAQSPDQKERMRKAVQENL